MRLIRGALSTACVAGAFVLASTFIAGCSGRSPLVSAATGTMRVQSLGESQAALSARLTTSLYGAKDGVETTFILTDAPEEQLISGTIAQGQVIHIELLWLPRSGWTPMSADATNASIRYVVISGGEVGVYGGAGFAMPQGELDGQSVNVTLHDASLKLMEHTPGFVDLLTPAKVSGTFTAENNPRKTRQAHFAMSQIVTDALGRSIFVNAADEPATGLAMRP